MLSSGGDGSGGGGGEGGEAEDEVDVDMIRTSVHLSVRRRGWFWMVNGFMFHVPLGSKYLPNE